MADTLNLIYAYTRKQAIEDGVLIDVSKASCKIGILYPVAVTDTLWKRYIEPDAVAKTYGQDETGRLRDVLWMFRIQARLQNNNRQFLFKALFMMGAEMKLTTLKAVIGPGDNLEPVITIMLPDED